MPDPRLLWPSVGAGLCLAAGAGFYFYFRFRSTPGERERKRRLTLHHEGRLADANVTDIGDAAVYYAYTVRGVEYSASQDISALHDRLPQDPTRLLGPAMLKYDPGNPANSIVLCEEWSGLRLRRDAEKT